MAGKFVPNDILKNITDIKSKIGELDVHEKYTMLADKYSRGSVVINANALNVIKELDKQISRTERDFIKSLNTRKI
jgi:hypothetical protein